MNREQDEQAAVWEALHGEVKRLLARYGIENSIGDGDYLVVDDNYGWQRIQVEVHNLKMLRPDIVIGLRQLLIDVPDWEITVSVHVPGKEAWPTMGLTIRKHEIIDGLQRQLFPPQCQGWVYPDSRPGTGSD